jgi:predicted component of type VI protein secretion system
VQVIFSLLSSCSFVRDSPAMDVRLVVEKGNTKRQTWHLQREETVVGRRRDCDLCILSAEVSRRHCLLSIEDGHVKVEDCESINGTFINGKRVVGKQILRPGDHLEIGPLEFIVEYELTPSALDRLAQQDAAGAAGDEGVKLLPLAKEQRKTPDNATTEFQWPPPAEEEEVPLAVIDEEEVANWHLPQSNELRDLLSQMEKPEAGQRRRKP